MTRVSTINFGNIAVPDGSMILDERVKNGEENLGEYFHVKELKSSIDALKEHVNTILSKCKENTSAGQLKEYINNLDNTTNSLIEKQRELVDKMIFLLNQYQQQSDITQEQLEKITNDLKQSLI